MDASWRLALGEGKREGWEGGEWCAKPLAYLDKYAHTINVSESKNSIEVGIQEFSYPGHQLGVIGGKYCHVVSGDVVQPASSDVQLDVHAGAIASVVKLSDDLQWR